MTKRLEIINAAELLKKPGYVGPVSAQNTDPEMFPNAISSAEYSIAQRLGCDIDEEFDLPRTAFPTGTSKNSTFAMIMAIYEKNCSTKPTTLIAEFSFDAEDVIATYWMPLAATGRKHQAASLSTIYSAHERRRHSTVHRELGRTSSRSRLIENPFILKSKPDDTPREKVNGRVLSNSKFHGRLGTRPY